MAKLTLRPWNHPKNKRKLLYWLCSPYRSNDGRWTVRAVFVSAADEERGLFGDEPTTYEISEFPWGLLPNLRVGRFYVNGVLETDHKPETRRIYVSDIQNGSFCSAFQIPKQLYSFLDNKMLGNERIWRFKVGNTIYYLPCLEIIRAFFAPSKTMTNQLLKPYGLESLIEDAEDIDGELRVNLSSDIPQSIINDEMVAHLLWLTYDEIARTSWQKVYNGIFVRAIENFPAKPTTALAEGLPLETIPPLENQCELVFTSTKVANSCLIHEILEVGDLPSLPFERVKYKHASLKGNIEKVNTNKASKKMVSLSRDGRYVHTDKRKRVKTRSNQPLVEIPKIVLSFAGLPQIAKQAISTNSVSSGESFISGKQNSSTNAKPAIDEEKEFSVDESYLGGEVRPIEFAGLKLVEKSDDQGLNDFISTLNFLAKLNPCLKIDFQIYSLPGNLPFCFIKDNIRRNFAIATISSDKGEIVYLLEISRLDNWQISTLLVKFNLQKITLKEAHQILLLIVKKMIENDGHWVLESLEQATKFRFKRIKHFNDDSVEAFASIINRQLLLYGLN